MASYIAGLKVAGDVDPDDGGSHGATKKGFWRHLEGRATDFSEGLSP